MAVRNFHDRFPHLFSEVTWSWGPTRATFSLVDRVPPQDKIANVNILPWIGKEWAVIQLSDGSWEIPGGTLEPGESYLDAVHRELMEEVGANLISCQLIGAWHCHSLAHKPYRPHLPFPNYYRLVFAAEIIVVNPPVNPPGGESVISVDIVPLKTVVDRFVAQHRYDLAELYQLAALFGHT